MFLWRFNRQATPSLSPLPRGEGARLPLPSGEDWGREGIQIDLMHEWRLE